MALPAVATLTMIYPDLSNCGHAGMTGDAVIPQLQTMRNRRRGTTQLGHAKPWRRDRQPVVFHKEFIGQLGHVALIAKFLLRVWGGRCIGILFHVITASAMAGETLFGLA